MSQNDFVIDNDTANAARLDIQSAFQALATNNSGASAPPTPYANQWWYETDTNLLKIRNEANTSWINVAYINQSTGKFEVLDDTKVVNTSGTQTGLLGDQATSAWEAGTSTTESLVSPAKVAAAVVSHSVIPPADYAPADQDMPSGLNSVTFTHGLGGVPSRVDVFLVCTSANNGYAAGDIIPLAVNCTTDGRTFAILFNSSIIKVTAEGNAPFLVNPNTGAQVDARGSSNFDVRVRAWR